MRGVVAGVVVVVAAVVLVIALRNTTMTVHTAMPADSTLVVEGAARTRGRADRAETLTQAFVNQCVAETSDDSIVGAFTWHGDKSFTAEVVPALDEPDRRQLSGCLTDFRMPRLLVTVREMRTVV